MDKLQVHDLECEQSVLGQVINDNRYYYTMAEILTSQMFYDYKHQQLFECIEAIINRGDMADMITLMEECIKRGLQVTALDISEISSKGKWMNFDAYCRRIEDLYKRRQLWMIGQELINAGENELQDTDEVRQKTMNSLQSLTDSPQSSISSALDAVQGIKEIFDEQLKEEGVGIKTQFLVISNRGGLRPKSLTLIAAKSGHGKSALALNIAIDAAIEGHPVVYYSLEMSKEELMMREVARQTKLPVNKLLTDYRSMSERQRKDIQDALSKIMRLPIHFDERATTNVSAIVQSIRTIKRKHGIQLAIVDYLQILPRNGSKVNEETALAEAARQLKNVAVSENIAVITLSQISRDQANSEPDINHIRGSGQIFEAVDNCIFLYRPQANEGNAKYNGANANVDPLGTAQLKIAKWRNGSTGATSIIGFHGEQTEFYELPSTPLISYDSTATPTTNNNGVDLPF